MIEELTNFDEDYEMERADEFAREIFYGIDEQHEYDSDSISEILTDWASENNSTGGLLLPKKGESRGGK